MTRWSKSHRKVLVDITKLLLFYCMLLGPDEIVENLLAANDTPPISIHTTFFKSYLIQYVNPKFV